MTEREQHEPDEVPTDEQLDVDGPNESTQPSEFPPGEALEANEDQDGDGDAAA